MQVLPYLCDGWSELPGFLIIGSAAGVSESLNPPTPNLHHNVWDYAVFNNKQMEGEVVEEDVLQDNAIEASSN